MSDLTGCLPATVTGYNNILAYLAGLGVTATLADQGGLRTSAEQDALYAQGRTTPGDIVTNAKGGQSYHNFGAAFDLYIESTPSGLSPEQALASAGAVASAYGLRWGGTFPDPDTDHFELDETLDEASQNYNDFLAQGGGDGSSGGASFPVLAGLAALGLVLYVVSRRFLH